MVLGRGSSPPDPAFIQWRLSAKKSPGLGGALLNG